MIQRFHKSLFIVALAAAALIAVPQLRAVPIVTNGGFETGDLTGWAFTGAASGSDFFVGNDDGVHSGSFAACFGAVSSDYDVIAQTLPTTAGIDYTLTFWLQQDGGGSADFQVLWNGVLVQDFPESGSFIGYTMEQFVVLGAGNDTLAFAGLQNPAWYSLDDVSVTSNNVIPEPSSFLLLISGLAGMAGVIRRKLTA